MNIKALATAALTALTLTASAPAQASNIDSHRVLWGAIENAGVTTYLNPSQLCHDERGINGAYISEIRVLVVCQDNGTADGPEVAWTANDLDTLRHEAQHLIQDCVDGGIGDNALSPFFGDDLYEYITNSTLTARQIESIIQSYTEMGADEDTIRLELEAFATAQDISPSSIANVVGRACSVN